MEGRRFLQNGWNEVGDSWDCLIDRSALEFRLSQSFMDL
jgi:hypothetical protein